MAELPPVPGFIVVDDGITEPNNRPLELQLGTALIAYQVPTDLPSTASVLTAVDEHFTSLGYERLRLVVPYTCESEGIIRDVYFGTEEVSFLVAMYSPDAISVTLLWTRDGPIGKSTGGYTSVDQPFTCNG